MKTIINNVVFSYPGIDVLKGVTFEVDDGEFVGIIGPNGSGKTTLLKCISGVLVPKDGSVFIGDTKVSEMSRREIGKLVGVVPQTSTIDFQFTVIDIVLMGRIPHIGRFDMQTNNDIEISENAMKLTGVSNLKNRLYNELSGGEKQRVIIARALTQEPSLLLLDEPTVHLDLGTQYEIMDLIKSLSIAKKITVIGVFHDLNIASQYCDRFVFLRNGAIINEGKPETVITPENIRDTYCIDVLVKKHPMTGSVYITPYYSRKVNAKNNGFVVHLICGGGSGALLMKLLKENGFGMSTGVLGTLDTDFEVAQALNIPTVTELPFSQITDKSFDSNIEMIKKSDIVLLADFPVGPGNLRNILAAEESLNLGNRLIILESTPPQDRDFTNGAFQEIYNRIKPKSKTVSRPDDAIELIRKILIEETNPEHKWKANK